MNKRREFGLHGCSHVALRSIYQQDYESKPLDMVQTLKQEKNINAEKMHKQFHHAQSIIKSSSYQVSVDAESWSRTATYLTRSSP